ncbi:MULTISPECIES: hypothetical protein [unclassified Bradyrhizobium]|uniref:hypothetical protein n=1 Tax=unclassified Bradyrhizobium TaxID=2631580 RepID=UPI001BA80528|nr:MULTISPECIES: hypothetical protein [unclassified Bradyrhizobium]MBR1224266.1 hypothetical protein [Bradyrhizobium sp. AUGA SZCCT0176]MBR1297770.1 hypothetical protein [Bradyrhizobium sp. AUGA SZCCT0042]
MKRLGITILLIAGVVVLWMTAFPSVTVRYRLTLEVELNGERKTGSNVSEVSYRKNPQFLGASASMVAEVRGEAVWVDLGERDTLLALLAPGGDQRRPEYVLPVLYGVTSGGVGVEELGRIGALEGRREVPLGSVPPMVRLRNVNDPKNVELVAPAGHGLKLVRATIEIVDAGYWPLNQIGLSGVPISHKLRDEIPWLDDSSGTETFWRSLYGAGFQSNGSVEPRRLLISGR